MIAVTGAGGYIGGATVRFLAASGPVLAIGRTAPAGLERAGVQVAATGEGPPTPEMLRGCTAVVHLAGRAHTQVASERGRDLFDEVNRQLAVRTAAAARAAGVGRFVFVSSIGVHGNWSAETVRADSPARPAAAYARSKWAAEQELTAACAEQGPALVIVRPPMVYGAGCPGNFPRLVRLVRSGLPLPFGAARAVRSFVHVDNLASFLGACAVGPLPAQRTFVAGDGSDWSLAELVRGMAAALDMPSRLVSVPPGLLRLAGTLIGRRRELESLTLPLRVDWQEAGRAMGWQPVLAPAEALRASVVGPAR